MKIFLSHSSRDKEVAEALIALLRSALSLKGAEIRCTSVEGHRLAGGADTDDELRREIIEAVVFIGLISEASVESAYVLFELGARWGAGKYLIPLLTHGSEVTLLKGPLSGKNALRCDDLAQVHQLVEEVRRVLSVEAEPAAVYQKQVDQLIELQRLRAGSARPARSTKGSETSDAIARQPTPVAENNLVSLLCVKHDLPYNSGEVAGFSPAEARRRINSGRWIHINAGLLQAARLILIEIERMQRIYAQGDERAIERNREDVDRALDRYQQEAARHPIKATKRHHLKLCALLQEAADFERVHPGGFIAFARPVEDLGEWVKDEELEARRRELL